MASDDSEPELSDSSLDAALSEPDFNSDDENLAKEQQERAIRREASAASQWARHEFWGGDLDYLHGGELRDDEAIREAEDEETEALRLATDRLKTRQASDFVDTALRSGQGVAGLPDQDAAVKTRRRRQRGQSARYLALLEQVIAGSNDLEHSAAAGKADDRVKQLAKHAEVQASAWISLCMHVDLSAKGADAVSQRARQRISALSSLVSALKHAQPASSSVSSAAASKGAVPAALQSLPRAAPVRAAAASRSRRRSEQTPGDGDDALAARDIALTPSAPWDAPRHDGHRPASRQILKNQGQKRYRKKDDRNPRTKWRKKFKKAMYTHLTASGRKWKPGNVPAVYSGEATGIKSSIVRSRQF